MAEGVREEDVDADPIVEVGRWYDGAVAAGVAQADAMALATVSAEGRPSNRMVLLKGLDQRGFAFYTNYGSRKAGELAANPLAALVLYWQPIGRQVRAEGRVHRVAPEESAAYFRTRPHGSRLSAWASPQSRVIPDRAILTDRVAEVAARFEGEDLPLPPHWGGYRLVPDVIELWQQRPDRLHDRLRYRLEASGAWRLERLAP